MSQGTGCPGRDSAAAVPLGLCGSYIRRMIYAHSCDRVWTKTRDEVRQQWTPRIPSKVSKTDGRRAGKILSSFFPSRRFSQFEIIERPSKVRKFDTLSFFWLSTYVRCFVISLPILYPSPVDLVLIAIRVSRIIRDILYIYIYIVYDVIIFNRRFEVVRLLLMFIQNSFTDLKKNIYDI